MTSSLSGKGKKSFSDTLLSYLENSVLFQHLTKSVMMNLNYSIWVLCGKIIFKKLQHDRENPTYQRSTKATCPVRSVLQSSKWRQSFCKDVRDPWWSGCLPMGLTKSRKRNDTIMNWLRKKNGPTCRRPRTYAENLLNVGAKKDAQDNVNV